jgi:hypothetical protein
MNKSFLVISICVIVTFAGLDKHTSLLHRLYIINFFLLNVVMPSVIRLSVVALQGLVFVCSLKFFFLLGKKINYKSFQRCNFYRSVVS